MIEESKYCIDLMKKQFNKELVMTKKDDEFCENSTKYWIYDNACFDCSVKVKEIIVISMENIEVLHIEILISMLN